ncbi:complement factor H [Oreochromis niloticus]|uniref:Complement factor H n=3 Tax=Oreochromis TaxID=8139 RepID=A0A7D3QKU8_ORENI|nr:complement factor H [Oreochromis niloticus]QKE53085.1 complement factor H [Oreochromis niloticus]QKE53086.1 complement factor H [Oreochromis niloticus]CAI5637022.1 unnamed protein product [Mustela putorius furo]
MRLSLILLFLQLWGHVEVSFSENVCSRLPNVPHSYVSENTKKVEYHEGDVIHFTCETGYISGPTIRYICTNTGWESIRRGKCTLKPCELPEDVPNGYYEIIHGEELVFGTAIKYFCNSGYTMGDRDGSRTCQLDGWSSTVPVCETAEGCEKPPNLSNGEPKESSRLEYSHNERVEYICQDYYRMEGGPYKTCVNGQWTGEMRCLRIPCAVGVMDPNLQVTGLPQGNEAIKTGDTLHFRCADQYKLEGSEVIECLETGYWNASFPSCSDHCKVTRISDSVRMTSHIQGNELKKGQKLTFTCLRRNHFMQGNKTVECLANGQWSDPFPTCGDPVGCEKPPLLSDGDTKTSTKRQYSHGESVEYICQNYYIMEGTPYKTCKNGKWTGQMRCLKPCTVNREDMRKHNIQFRYVSDDKLYSQHNDVIEFRCTRGRPVGSSGMRQKCIEGVMHLPTCQ